MGSLHGEKSRQPTTTATMKLNISFPANGSQKLIEIEDDRKLRVFMDKRMGQEVPGDSVGDEFKGYIFKITGGNDKQGFPMKQGVVTQPVSVSCSLTATPATVPAEPVSASASPSVDASSHGPLCPCPLHRQARRQRHPRYHRHRPPQASWSQACHEDPQVLRPHQGR